MFSLNEQKAIELGESGEKAVREKNEYDALQYIEYLREFGSELIEGNLEKDLKRVIISIRNIGSKAVQKRIDAVAASAVQVLKSLAEPALEKNLSNAMWSFSKAVQEIGKGAVQFQMLEPAQNAVDTLEIIGSGAVAKRMEVVTLWTTMALEEMSYLADRQQLEDPRDIGNCLDIIREMGREIPLLGVCLGHQAINVAFGGPVRRCKVGPVHGKSSKIMHTESALFTALKEQFEAGRYHSLEIGEPAPGIKVTARAEDGTIMAVEHSEYPIYGLQFHPESVLTPEGLKIIQRFLEISRDFKKRQPAV